MATTTLTAGQISATAALSASTVDTINYAVFTPAIEVVCDSGGPLYVTVDGTTPTVGGAGTYVVPASSVRTIRLGPSLGKNPVVKLIATGTPTYNVTAAQSA